MYDEEMGIVPPRSQPSVSKLIMPRLLWPSAGISSFGPTLCRLTARGTAMPCSFPSVLIHMHRALWMWPAIIRTVRRGAPGTGALHSSGGNCSKRKTVIRLLVLHAASSISRWSSADFITSLQKMIKPIGVPVLVYATYSSIALDCYSSKFRFKGAFAA